MRCATKSASASIRCARPAHHDRGGRPSPRTNQRPRSSQVRTAEQLEKLAGRRAAKARRRQRQWAEMGIEYDFAPPGAAVTDEPRARKDGVASAEEDAPKKPKASTGLKRKTGTDKEAGSKGVRPESAGKKVAKKPKAAPAGPVK